MLHTGKERSYTEINKSFVDILNLNCPFTSIQNMRALLIILFSCMFSFFGFCQSVKSFKDRNTGFIGFRNENGDTIIHANKFHKWTEVSEGMILVAKDGKWGYCDFRGNVLIPLIYEHLSSFYEGLALASINAGEYGYIDKTGKVVIAFKYSKAKFFREGWAPVKLGERYQYIDKKGSIVLEHKYELAWPFKEGLASIRANGNWGFIDRTGKEICDIKYASANDFSEGLAVVSMGDKYSFIDRYGKQIIEPIYDYMHDFKEGLATVKVGKKYAFINKSGKQIIEPVYDLIDDFNEGFARVKVYGRIGLIDKIGKTIIEPIYKNVFHFNDGIARVFIEEVICDGLGCSYINTNGDFITTMRYYSVRSTDFKNGFAIVDNCHDGTKGVIDKSGKEIIEAKYKSISFSSGVFTAVDRNGEEFKFDQLGNAVMVKVQIGDYFGSLETEYNLKAEQLFSGINFNGGYFYDSANLKAVNSYLNLATDLTSLKISVDKLLSNAAKNKKSYQDFSAYLYNKYIKPTPACYKAISIHIALDHLCNLNAPHGGAYWIDKIQLEQICDRAKKAKSVPCN